MNDLIPSASVSGTINYQGVDLYDKDVDPVREEKDRYGVSEAKSFPKTIRENIAFGLVNEMTDNIDDRIEKALTQAAHGMK